MYLIDLSSRPKAELGNHGVLAELNVDAPSGGIAESPILCNLISALRLEGSFASVAAQVHSGIDPRDPEFDPQKKDKI